ncbi:peptidoglycan DD-metalloendopeptidase family protein [Streptomyces sp. NPDC026673]|uniref:M23 family metallopeptidase n=1 Tax=Streptomyces sp. NPDC026673 TaxID=3155724 RepID=UPI0033D8D276
MNDRHPAGYAPEYSSYGYEGHSDASYAPMGAAHADDDPLFGSCQGYPAYDTGTYATGSWDTTATAYWPAAPAAPAYPDPTGTTTGTWYADATQAQPAAAYDYTQYEHTAVHGYEEPEAAHGHAPDPYEPDAYAPEPYAPETYEAEAYEAEPYGSEPYEAETYEAETYEPETYDVTPDANADGDDEDEGPDHDTGTAAAALPRPRGGNGSRRRRPVRRSALLTVAVPSVAVMGVAACAAAVTVNTEDADSSRTQADGAPEAANAPTTKLDQQLAGVNRDVDDFADRASRTQERIDLKERQALERAKKAAEAARKEQLRPKFLLPVKEHGLSAFFGQAGVNWMSVHTGIDFPVDYGTPVMAATDGVVRTQWNSAYGNMAIVTAPDGTETWYCHLSSTKIRSGTVKAGDVIAYSGNSGNSTGPHLHFEVRPGGGAAIDPLQWLLKHGIDPR